MITKEKLKFHIEQLPEELTLDELIDRLIFIDKVERANEESQNGEIVSEQELDQAIEKWFS